MKARNRHALQLLLAALLILAGCSVVIEGAEAGPFAKPGQEWPAWRGPYRNNLSLIVPQKLPEQMPVAWEHPMVGETYSGVAVDEGLVVAVDHERGKRDIVRCYKAEDGSLVWKQEWENTFMQMPWGSCPRATPAIHEGMVYVVSALGKLKAFRLKTGELVWEKDYEEDFDGMLPMWGYSSSPLVADGKVIANPGGQDASVVALDAATGEVIWKSPGMDANYASFITATVNGKEQVVGYDLDNAVGRSLETGEVIWTKWLPPNQGFVVPSPVVADGALLVDADGYLYKMTLGETGELPDEWEAENDRFDIGDSTPVVIGDIVLGVTSDGLTAVDTGDLSTLWTRAESAIGSLGGFANIIAENGRALVLDEGGVLRLFEFDRSECREVGALEVCGGIRAHPALVEGRLYLRSGGKLLCRKLSTDTE